MPIVVMLFTLSGSFGFTGGAPVISGFATIAACERAIPRIRQFYGSATKVECVSFPSE